MKLWNSFRSTSDDATEDCIETQNLTMFGTVEIDCNISFVVENVGKLNKKNELKGG